MRIMKSWKLLSLNKYAPSWNYTSDYFPSKVTFFLSFQPKQGNDATKTQVGLRNERDFRKKNPQKTENQF